MSLIIFKTRWLYVVAYFSCFYYEFQIEVCIFAIVKSLNFLELSYTWTWMWKVYLKKEDDYLLLKKIQEDNPQRDKWKHDKTRCYLYLK